MQIRRAIAFPLACLALSLAVHLLTISSEFILAWWQQRGHPEEDLITATQSKLGAQSVALDESNDGQLDGVVPAGELSITFAKSRPRVSPVRPQISAPRPEAAARSVKREPTAASSASEAPPAAPSIASPNPEATASPVPPPSQPVVAPAPSAAPATPAPATPASEAPAPRKSTRPVLGKAFPANVDIHYMVKGLVDAEHHWRIKGKQFEISTKGGLFGKFYEWKSEGCIDEHGLQPTRFTEWRDKQPTPKYQVDFDWSHHKARYGEPGSQQEAELIEGAQDMFSAAYQFALQGDKLPSFTMQIVTGRNSYIVPFELKGESQLWLSGRRVRTLVLSGTYKDIRFSFYLAPEWHNLPVRILRVDDKGDIDLRATSIDIDGKPALELQKLWPDAP